MNFPDLAPWLDSVSDILLEVPAEDTPRIQEAHLVLGHVIRGLVEQAMFPPDTFPGNKD